MNTVDLLGIETASRAVPFSAIDHLAKRLGSDASSLLDLIGIPERTRFRRRHEGFLKPDEADRLQRIARVFGEAVRVFGSEEKAARWLKTPGALFEESAPLSRLDSDAGAHAVSEEIVRIDFGDFA
jgi:putative toxin-antitoxin system antitoxin component (TIGR02293 family)